MAIMHIIRYTNKDRINYTVYTILSINYTISLIKCTGYSDDAHSLSTDKFNLHLIFICSARIAQHPQQLLSRSCPYTQLFECAAHSLLRSLLVSRSLSAVCQLQPESIQALSLAQQTVVKCASACAQLSLPLPSLSRSRAAAGWHCVTCSCSSTVVVLPFGITAACCCCCYSSSSSSSCYCCSCQCWHFSLLCHWLSVAYFAADPKTKAEAQFCMQ